MEEAPLKTKNGYKKSTGKQTFNKATLGYPPNSQRVCFTKAKLTTQVALTLLVREQVSPTPNV